MLGPVLNLKGPIARRVDVVRTTYWFTGSRRVRSGCVVAVGDAVGEAVLGEAVGERVGPRVGARVGE
jgi:hypothetical protein